MNSGQFILLVDSITQQSQVVRKAVADMGISLDIVEELSQTQSALQQKKYQLIICNLSQTEILKWLQQSQCNIPVVGMAPAGIQNALHDMQNSPFIDFMICQDFCENEFAIKNIQATLNKILSHDIFGIEKYLSKDSEIHEIKIERSSLRSEYTSKLQDHFKKLGLRASLLDRCWIVTEEMLMNAIYDAPTDSKGKSLFNHLPRTQEIVLAANESAKLRFASDGEILAISVTDPFGVLKKKTIFDYLQSCYQGNAGSMNKEKGGAGRGLHQIVENSDLVIFNVKDRVKTEVLCLICIESAMKANQHTPLFHYCFQ